MPRYSYVAVDSRGQESTGSVEATSPTEAVGQLRQGGYFPTSVYEEGKGGPDGKTANRSTIAAPRPARKSLASREITLFQRKKVKPKTLMIFTRQLATLI